MKKSEIKMRMREGFLQLSPDVFETVQEAVERENQTLQETEIKKSEIISPNKNSASTEKRRNFYKYAISSCVCMALLCICLLAIFGKSRDDICLVLDINPSIQIVMDDSLQVKCLRGLNQDGKEVVKKIEWNKKELLFDMLDRMLDSIVEDTYLKKDGGILVTICLSDHEMYEKLENKMGESIDRKLQELGIPEVITAFQQGDEKDVESGRKQLEEKLAREYGVNVERMQRMSVMDLIRCSRKFTSLGVSFSAESERQLEELSVQKDGQDEKEEQRNREKSHSDGSNQKELDKADVKQKSEKKQSNMAENKKPTDEKKEEGVKSSGKKVHKPDPEGVGQPQGDRSPSVSLAVPAWTEPENNPSQNQPESNGNGLEKDKNTNGNNKDKDKNGNNKDKDKNGNNKNKDKNGNNKDKNGSNKDKNGGNKDKDKNGSSKDKNGGSKGEDKNGSHKDENKNGSNQDKNGGSKDKDKNGNNEDKEKNENNKDKVSDSSKNKGMDCDDQKQSSVSDNESEDKSCSETVQSVGEVSLDNMIN